MERRRMTTRKLVALSLLAAVMVGLQVALAALPNIEAVSLLVMVYTVVLGSGVA